MKRRRSELDTVEEEIVTASTELSGLASARKHTEASLRDAKSVLEKQTEELEKLERELPNIQAKINQCNEDMRSDQQQSEDLHMELDDLREQETQLKAQSAATTREMNNLHDARSIFRERITKLQRGNGPMHMKKRFTQTIEAMDHIDRHLERWKETGKLKGTITGPVASLLHVDDPAIAVMLEKAIPEAKMFSFVVEHREDREFIIREFENFQSTVPQGKEKGLKCDVITMNNKIRTQPRHKHLVPQFKEIGESARRYVLSHVALSQ